MTKQGFTANPHNFNSSIPESNKFSAEPLNNQLDITVYLAAPTAAASRAEDGCGRRRGGRHPS